MGEDIEYRLKALEEDSRRNQDTHKEFFARLETINSTQARTDERYTTIIATLTKLEAAVEELKAKPSKRWDAVIAAVITGVVGFVVAWITRGGV